MADERFDVPLRVLERSERPEPAFADALFARLAAEAGFRPGPVGGWWARVDGVRATLAGRLELAWLVVFVALLVTIIAAMLVAGGGSRPRPGLADVAPTVAPGDAPSDASRTTDTATAPAGSPAPRPESGVLRVGEPAPAWTGTLLDGGSLSTDQLRGRPAAVLLWCSCAAGPYARTFLEAAATRSDDIGLVFVSLDTSGTTRGLVDAVDARTPVVEDEQWDLLRAWDLQSYPALVLLRADGTVADLQPVSFGPAKLGRILDALQAGGPIPEPDPFPSPGDGSRSSVLEVGRPAPELRGPRLGGGELSTRDLVGRPTVVVHWVPPDAAGNPPDDAPGVDRLLEAAAARQGKLDVLLVAHGERTTGDVAAYLASLGNSDVPVIFDWDGALSSTWALVYWPTVVALDAEGNVAGYYGAEALTDPEPLLDELIGGGPLSSPVGRPPGGG